MVLISSVLMLAAILPARADVTLYAHRLDAVHVNVYRPLGARAAEVSAPEVSMFFGKLDVLVDPGEFGYPEEGGCVDIYNDGVVDAGCGVLTIEPDGVVGTTSIQGTIDSYAYGYDPETGFEEIGPSQIVVDLVVTADGPIELSPYTNHAAGVCGLPPDMRGVFVDDRPELQRTASMSGGLVSQVAGEIDPATLPALLVQAFNVAVAACV